ncbi:glycoside hydrolase family 30 protein [Calocera viscosa TUFC12733]|uniref:Glycoside hydrolase family 30 protein n=1 Tax=Calocera viscosa (strain TUFC12733) TaxID=1330018 RepID=A0A167RBI0_CALVF|nr:glycoside hydrolase family 30 protein [Calocera viscosa TUFC12733]
MPASLSQLATGILCEVFLWQSGVQIANITNAAQTMQGIGASGAWWPLDVYNYPDTVRQNVSYLLFSNDTLGLTSYRYNVGGGGEGVGNPSRAPETMYVSSGVWNYSADPQGSYFLRAAAQYGVPQLTAFVNSAPPAFTTNGEACGGFLNNASIPSFSTYLADVVSYWKTQGIDFAYVSPMNEPDNSFGPANGSVACTQEGMAILPVARAPVVSALRSALDTAGLSSVLVQADETSTQIQFAVTSQFWLPGAASSLGAVSHHDYLFADDTALQLMGEQGRQLSGKQMWFTEICCFVGAGESTDPAAALVYGQGYDPTMLSALQMANLIYRAFTVTGDAHFDWWLALSSEIGCDPSSNASCATSINDGGWNDGLIYYDPSYYMNGNTALYLTKRYFVLKHFTHAIPIGAVRYEVSTFPSPFRLIAFKLPTGGWSIIALNLEPSEGLLALSTLDMGAATAAYQTTTSEDWETLNTASALSCGTVFQMVLPGSSVTSIYFSE